MTFNRTAAHTTGRGTKTLQSLQVAGRWRDGVRTYIAWWTHAPARVGNGSTRSEAIRNIPIRAAITAAKGDAR